MGHVNGGKLAEAIGTRLSAARAVSAYENYITFASIEFKGAEICFCQNSPMVNDSV